MNKFFLITNEDKDPDLSVTRNIRDIFEKEGCECRLASYKRTGKTVVKGSYTDPETVPKDTECVVSLGGDGTLIQAFRDTYSLDIPVIGINFGTLGFLAEVDPACIKEAVLTLKTNNYLVEKRMLLSGTIKNEGGGTYDSFALNDIVVLRDGPLRVVRFNIHVNGRQLVTVMSDGIIISTPTGSTGYNLSAGGPIVEPSASLMVLTPICAHSLKMRSVILSENDEVVIEPVFTSGADRGLVSVCFDGRESLELKSKDKIIIRKGNASMKLIKLSSDSFMEVLHKKMND